MDLTFEELEPAERRIARIAEEPAGLAWANVFVRVVDDDAIEVVAGGSRERRTFAECGLGDGRKHDRDRSGSAPRCRRGARA